MWEMPAVKILDHCIDSVLSKQCFLQTKNHVQCVVSFISAIYSACVHLLIELKWKKCYYISDSNCCYQNASLTTASFLSYFNPSFRDFKNCVYFFLGVVIGEISIFHYYQQAIFFQKEFWFSNFGNNAYL